MHGRTLLARAAFVLVAIASCTVPVPDLAGKACPCTADFECDVATNTCVAPGSLTPDGAVAADGAPFDGPPPDSDGAMPSDASIDADADASRTFCASLATKPTFCADFDSIPAVPWGFSTFASGGGLLGVDTTTAQGGQSAYFEVKSETANNAHATLTKAMATALTTTSKLDIELDLLVEKMDVAAEVVQVLISATNVDYKLYLSLESGTTKIQEETTPNGGSTIFGTSKLSAPVSVTSGWVHVRWNLVNSTTDTTSAITITGGDGGVISSGTANLSMYKYGVAPMVLIGIPYVDSLPTNGWRMRADNVVIDQH